MTTASKKLHDDLAVLARQGLVHVDKKLVVDVAKALWYSSELPDLAGIKSPHRRDAYYLVDRLARFNVLPKARKLELLALLEQFGKSPDSKAVSSTSHDPLAVNWGASADLARFMPDLLPLQTRHYAATQRG